MRRGRLQGARHRPAAALLTTSRGNAATRAGSSPQTPPRQTAAWCHAILNFLNKRFKPDTCLFAVSNISANLRLHTIAVDNRYRENWHNDLTPPNGATARCRDGFWSWSRHPLRRVKPDEKTFSPRLSRYNSHYWRPAAIIMVASRVICRGAHQPTDSSTPSRIQPVRKKRIAATSSGRTRTTAERVDGAVSDHPWSRGFGITV